MNKKEYYQKNKTRIIKAAKEWNYRHYDKILEDSKKYYQNHREERIAYYYNRDNHLRESYFGLSARQAAIVGIDNAIAVYIRSKGLCEQCGATKKKNNHAIHHIDEAGYKTWKAMVNKKVNDNPSNLLLLCASCHSKTHYEIKLKHKKEVFLNRR